MLNLAHMTLGEYPDKVDPRFLLDPARCDVLAALVADYWPERIAPADLGDPALWQQCRVARAALLDALGFAAGEL